MPQVIENMKVLQINTALITDAPGRIAEEIGMVLIANGHESYIGYGRATRPITSKPVKIGNKADQLAHLLLTRIFDRHGFGSGSATVRFIEEIRVIDPDIIHLHNLHGYYLNIEVLFSYLKKAGKPIVWTLHDCWPFTGHCSHFDSAACYKWHHQCYECPKKRDYPASWLIDNSRDNFKRKKELFTGLHSMTFVSPSNWLAAHFRDSFLKSYPIKVIPNGLDITVFNPDKECNPILKKYGIGDRKPVLGVANIWGRFKGFNDFIKLSEMLPEDSVILLVGVNEKERESMPKNMIGIARTENIEELSSLYAAAAVFVNPTYVDTFPTTNLEALACGTPVITYNTGGSPEAIDPATGQVVEKGNVKALAEAVNTMLSNGKSHYSSNCRARAVKYYKKEDRYLEYLSEYQQFLEK